MNRKVHAPDVRHPGRRDWSACGVTGTRIARSVDEVTCARCLRSEFAAPAGACGACAVGHHRSCFAGDCSCECDVRIDVMEPA